MRNEKPKSNYGQWIIGLMLVAYLATSFDYRYFSFQSPMVTIGDRKIGRDQFVQRMREEKAYATMTLTPPPKKWGDMYFMRKVALDDMWDQEAQAMGIKVSENRARDSLRQKLCFLDASGQLDQARLMQFYQKHPDFFEKDLQSQEERGGVLTSQTVPAQLFRGNQSLLDPADRFDEGKAGLFLRNNGVSLLQMIAAEQRYLRRAILKNALAKNVFLPQFYKDMVQKGQSQVRTWHSRLFPINSISLDSVIVSEKETLDYAENRLSKWAQNCPEMRTFTVMITPNFGTLTPTFGKNGERISKQTEIEDALGSGKSLQDVAKENGYTWAKMTSSAMGQSRDFSPISWQQSQGKDLPFAKDMKIKVLQRVFLEQEGVYTLPFMMGGMVWIQVQDIHEKRPLSQKEKQAVAAHFLKKEKRTEEVRLQAQNFEKTLLSKTSKHKDMPLYTADAADDQPPEGITPELMSHVFQMTPPKVTSVLQTPEGYHVIRLVSVASKKADIQLNTDTGLVRQWRAAFLHAYLLGLQKKYPVVANEEAFQSLLGTDGILAQQEDMGTDIGEDS